MRLSDLQKYILKQVYLSGPKCPRAQFLKFYREPEEEEVKIVTKSIERLIAKGMLIGYGHKTAEKYFIESVSLTPQGGKRARTIVRDQPKLPFMRRQARR